MTQKTKTVLSFEEQVLTSHDWTAKTQLPEVTKVTQDDYDDGDQEIYIERADGSVVRQIRRWEGDDHDAYYAFNEQNPKPTHLARLNFIEEHSELIEEEEVRPPKEDVPGGFYSETEDLDNFESERITLEALEVLSMEFRQDIVKDAATAFGKLTSIGDVFRKFVARRHLRKEFEFDDYDFKKFAVTISKIPYVSMVDLRVFCPPGMSSSYLELLTVLVECQQFAEKTLNETLRPFKTWAGSLYNDPQKLRSVRPNGEFVLHSPEALSKRLSAACSFSGESTRAYGDCFERNTDWIELHKKVEELFATYPSANVETFDKETKDAARLVGMLANQINLVGKDKASQEVATQLGDSCYQIAKQVEFYAVYNTVMRSTLAALKQTIDHYKKTVLR